MKSFSIRELQNLSDIKAHTIRIWEKRYHIFTPQRNNGNFRCYNLEQVRHLLHISLLIKSGYKISKLAEMEDSVFPQLVYSLTSHEQRRSRAVNSLIVHMFSMDIEEFEGVLDECILSWGIDKTITQIIIPFLQKTEILSYRDSSSQVHFAVTAVRKKLIMGIEKMDVSCKTGKTALLFLPQNEHYDLVLLYMTYLLKNRGLKVLYLGTNISIVNLKTVLETKKPDYLYTYFPDKTKFRIADFLDFLNKSFPQTRLFVARDENEEDSTSDPVNLHFIHYQNTAAILDQCFA